MHLDRTACYAAILARDSRFDGRFYTAVRTTGIYCRPVCPARVPHLQNVEFLPSAAAAEDAGYRACLRCGPKRGGAAPLSFQVSRISSPLGAMLAVTDGDALIALDFADYEIRMRRLLRLYHGVVTLTASDGEPAPAVAIRAYFDGNLSALDHLPLRTGGTEFQRRVWDGLRSIPAGWTTSYGELARRIGKPAASRAVGMANGANPISIAVPCHRVIGSNGALTGYGGGLPRKAWLLAHESRHASAIRQGIPVPPAEPYTWPVA